MKISLHEAMRLAPGELETDRARLDSRYGTGLFEAAVAHHAARNLRADVDKGTTRDRDGIQSRFIAYDWADVYKATPAYIWSDFFRSAVANSCSRMARGLKP